MSIGSRSQSAKTYLEKHFESFADCGCQRAAELWHKLKSSPPSAGDSDALIKHGLYALRETIQNDKELNTLNTSIGIVGKDQSFTVIEGDDLQKYLDMLEARPERGSGGGGAAEGGEMEVEAAAEAGANADEQAGAGENQEDVEMNQ